MLEVIKVKFQKYFQDETGDKGFGQLERSIIELNNFGELNKVFSWDQNPILDRPDIHDFKFVEDVNKRRLRDAESIATVVRNSGAKTILEIGTANGNGTVLLAANAPESKIHTVNIPPEDILSGEGGKMTTGVIEKDEIGSAFRERGLKNINQIFANTATWQPDIGTIDIAFIDGCHDSEFVYNDTKKVLGQMKSGSFILWHDFNLDLAPKYVWINDVCQGVERLFREGLLSGRIFHVKDSWVGIYQV